MNIPEGMLPVEEYAKRNGIEVDLVIARIKDAEYIGRKIEDQWYVASSISNNGNKATLTSNDKTEISTTNVVITNFNMPFWSMVKFMVKWVIASIPAIFILFVIALVIQVVLISLGWVIL